MLTGNSKGIVAYADLMRQAGASARQKLVGAAAARWGIHHVAASLGGQTHDARRQLPA